MTTNKPPNTDANSPPKLSGDVLRMSPELAIRDTADPEVRLYPTIGYPISGGALWRIQIQGRISQSGPTSFGKRLILRGLIRALDLPPPVCEGEMFQDRVRGFLDPPVAGVRIQVQLAGQHYVLRRKSKASGLFGCKLDLTTKQLEGYRTYGLLPPSKLPNAENVCLQKWENGLGQTSSPVFLAERQGVSVVTDIDDTIKLTEVNSRRRMLQRTFAEPFVAIEGMSQVYQKWAEQGALFHYVSSSPWQIYDSLYEFLVSQNFPIGSMHLKWFRLRDEIFKRWQILRRKSKAGVIRNLMRRLPDRSFVFVGDSGERDPEIYAKLAAKYPRQVARICIRQIDAHPLDAIRLNKIYRRYGMTVPIQVFSNASQLLDLDV